MRIVIHVEGGIVQGIWGTDSIEIEVQDFDIMEAEGLERSEREAILDKATDGLTPLY